jgi:hypothetical protein
LSIAGPTTVEDVVGTGGSITAQNVPVGSYILSESSAGGLLSNYASSYSCVVKDQNGSQISAFADQNTTTGTLQLVRNQTIDCTFTNTRLGGKLTITKSLNNDAYPVGSPGRKTLPDFLYEVSDKNGLVVFNGNFSAGSVSHNLDPNFAPYNVVEKNNAGYSVAYSDCTAIMVQSGGQYNCLVTNTGIKQVPTGTTTMKWILHDSFTLASFRGNPADGGAQVVFTLYAGVVCSGTPIHTETINIGSDGKASTSAGKVVGTGTYRWIAKYNSNAYNQSFTTACGSEETTITGN